MLDDLAHGAAPTRVTLVMDAVRTRIAERALVTGARLPSLRTMAGTLKVSKSTVVEAYERLAAEGTIVPRHGSGFYVAGHARPFALAEIAPAPERAIDPLWIMRQSLEADAPLLKPGCGWLPASFMPEAQIRGALRRLARSGAVDLVDYSAPLGSPALRRLLSRRLTDRGIEAAPEQVLLAESGTQAIDLLCRFFLEPNDAVIVDDPCYFNVITLLKAHRARLVGVPYTPAGPDLDAFAAAAAAHRPRLYITNSAPHNPTGAGLAPAAAHRLLKLAESHGIIVIEDDIFADFQEEPVARLAAFDGLDRVVSVGSFSKTLSAAVRCGYIAARGDWIEGLTDLKLATSFGNGRLSAELVHALLVNGSYRRHVEGLRTKLAGAMSETIRRLRRLGIAPWTEAQAGMFLWARLPHDLDAAEIARRALADGVVLAPGNVFSLGQSARSFLRFNIAQCASPRIFEVLEKAMSGKRRA